MDSREQLLALIIKHIELAISSLFAKHIIYPVITLISQKVPTDKTTS